MKQKELNREILILQCIGIFTVVAGHCKNGFLNMGGLLPYYNYHMPLFVFISGYFFHANKTFMKFTSYKAKKMLIPYFTINFFFVLLSTVLKRSFGFNLGAGLNMKTLFWEPLFPGVLAGFNSATWFVICLFCIEIIYYVLYNVLKKKNRFLLLITLLLGYCAVRLSIGKIYECGLASPWTIRSILRVFTLMPYFCIGHIYKQKENIFKQIPRKWRMFLVCGILIITYYFCPGYYKNAIDYKYCNFVYGWATYIVAICGIFFWLEVSKMLEPSIGKSKLVELIGRNTFSIMSYHLLGFFVVNGLFVIFANGNVEEFLKAPREAAYTNGLNSWIYVVLSIAISLIIKKYIDLIKEFIIKRVGKIKMQDNEKKKYKVGYMAGVYDLFHVGHLNLINRAKEQCEYLIVGVLTDEEVMRWKKDKPFIPFEERYRIIEAIGNVDQVVKVTSENIARLDSWNIYHFDCQFSGSDYENNPGWLKDREELRKRGSDIVFLPYTQTTSSTKIKSLIEKELAK